VLVFALTVKPGSIALEVLRTHAPAGTGPLPKPLAVYNAEQARLALLPRRRSVPMAVTLLRDQRAALLVRQDQPAREE
jgi:hypothetical protein